MYKNIDIHKAYQSAENLLKLKREENLPDSIKISINYNIAMFYYLRKEYNPAYSLFIENVRFYHNYEELLLIGSICTHQNLPLPEDFNKENINTYRNQDYIHYYELKKKGESDEVLVKYIMKILVPNHLIHLQWKHPEWSIFEYELLLISKKQKKFYNSYQKYREKMDKTCKDF